MEVLRNWLLGVTAAAILCALANSLMPQGGVRKVGQLACGLVMLAAILRPLVQLQAVSPAQLWETGLVQDAGRLQELGEDRDETMKSLIEEELEAYIVDKAAQLGVSCTPQITCQPGENGVFLPERAVVQGSFTPEQQQALSQVLEEELGVSRDRQSFQTEEESP